MIIQGTTGTGKSYLIGCIKETLSSTTKFLQNPLLFLALTNVATFNIQASTIHSTLCIPIKHFLMLEGNSLSILQEDLKHIRYILIDEMSFIGPTLFSHIDKCLREAFPLHKNTPFGGFSIILIGDLDQFPPIKDIPLYASASHGSTLWCSFNTMITLQTIFCQQGDDPSQVTFRNILHNIRNAEPSLEDWNLLMSRTNSFLSQDELCTFHASMHLFATNKLATQHNQQMLKFLNIPIALSNVEQRNNHVPSTFEDEQLDPKVLLCPSQKVMLTSNLWVAVGLVNGCLVKLLPYSTKKTINLHNYQHLWL
jgi:ATP-dependent DNA helicase PIF1